MYFRVLYHTHTHTERSDGQHALSWPSSPPAAAAKFEAISLDLWKEACGLGSIHPGLFHSEREAAVNDCSLICDLSQWSTFSLRTNPRRQHHRQLSWPNLNADTISAFTPLVITGGRLSVTWGEEGTSWLLDMNPMTFSVCTHTKPKFL